MGQFLYPIFTLQILQAKLLTTNRIVCTKNSKFHNYLRIVDPKIELMVSSPRNRLFVSLQREIEMSWAIPPKNFPATCKLKKI